MSLRRVAELSLIFVAAVWGLTFVMVQDAIEKLPTLAFLGWRFSAAAIVVALICWRSLCALLAAASSRASGWASS